VARAIVLAATHPNAAGRVFNVTDGTFHTVAEITRAIADGLGRRAPRWALPLPLARTACAVVEIGAKSLGRRPLVTRATLEKYTEDVAVSGRRIRDELGFEPRWGLAEGWKRTVREMREQGRL
jgi:nucleoside-diphosphate-sugar epimerase